ncbi:MAG: glycoside hydrolase family 125 protein [Vulcanimicrobiaceae bacterium]
MRRAFARRMMGAAAGIFASGWLLCFGVPASSAQTLIVPLTGQRHREIETDSLFHTLFTDFYPEDDETTYVQTGDIPAMWLRDSAEQTLPYVRFQVAFPILRNRIAGVIERNARNIVKDVYANAFTADYGIWERKWEIDSPGWPMLLARVYWERTHDRSVFTPTLHVAIKQVVFTYGCEEHHRACNSYHWTHPVPTHKHHNRNTGLIWSAFRPSDDPVEYRFNIPQNAFAVIALRAIAKLAVDGYGDRALARQALAVATRVQVGIERYGLVYDRQRNDWMYAYETDGNGRFNLMDDANIPNLTTLPGIGWCSAYDPVYLATRAFTLSPDNPWYFAGKYGAGLGSPHTPYGYVWPLGIIGRALTATSSLQVLLSITTLAETDSETGLIHESFYPGGYWRYTRAEFGWGNALYAELIFRSVAGFPAASFTGNDTAIPFEMPSQTPTLVPEITQLDNTAELMTTLGRLLYLGRMQPGTVE